VFDSRQAIVFCLWQRFAKHKLTRYAKIFGGAAP